MKNPLAAVAFTIILIIFPVPGHSQSRAEPLSARANHQHTWVEGRFDHLAVDLKGNRLFLAAQAHKSVEVFDLLRGKESTASRVSVSHMPKGMFPASNELLGKYR